DEALAFYEGLEADNSKPYWTSHKAVYDSAVLKPMADLVEEVAAELGPLVGNTEAKIFRPYRDIRFSADKTPYKTHIGATIGGHAYVQFSADGLGTGAGMWHLEAGELARYRTAVADDASGKRLTEVIAAIEKDGHEIHGHGSLKSAPRGYPADHPRIALLRHKGLTSWRHWTPGPWLATAEAKDRVLAFQRACAPLVDWLHEHVG
ncbi:MAG: hypothetical protein JWM19_2453, partial [Actinomycetia bacterium]|nr:hypothetical protein [Actinomycetes bacterium]